MNNYEKSKTALTFTRRSRHRRLLNITLIGMLSAVAFLLSIFPKFTLFPAAPWLDIDLSDMPALVAGYMLGPVPAVLVVTVKSILHMLLVSNTGFVGLAANLIIGISFVLTAALVFYAFARRGHTGFAAMLVSSFCAIPIHVIAAIISNIYILVPLYGIDLVGMFGTPWGYIAILIPHNIIKAAIASAVGVALTLALRPALKKFLYFSQTR